MTELTHFLSFHLLITIKPEVTLYDEKMYGNHRVLLLACNIHMRKTIPKIPTNLLLYILLSQMQHSSWHDLENHSKCPTIQKKHQGKENLENMIQP
jgi:hypothetical protein